MNMTTFSLNWVFKPFDDLTSAELYRIIALREDCFAELHQKDRKINFKECDGFDEQSHHLIGSHEGQIIGYARVIPPQTLFRGKMHNQSQISRVAVHKDYQGFGLGHLVLQKAIAFSKALHGEEIGIRLGARTDLEKFYARYGFLSEGEIYFKKDIPHIWMTRP